MPAILQGAHSCPSEWPLTCIYSIPASVKTAFCPCGVRNPGVRLVSATHVLDHVPLSPAESRCGQFSCRHPAVPPSAGQTPRRQPAAADDRTEATASRVTLPHHRIRSEAIFQRPATDSRPGRRGGNDPHGHTRLPAFLPLPPYLRAQAAATQSRHCRRRARCPASRPEQTAGAGAPRLPTGPARPRPASQATDHHRPAMYPGLNCHRPWMYLASASRRPAPAQGAGQRRGDISP